MSRFLLLGLSGLLMAACVSKAGHSKVIPFEESKKWPFFTREEALWIAEQRCSFSDLQNQVLEEKSLKKTFYATKKLAKKVLKTTFVGSSIAFADRNQNNSHFPFDENRVGREWESFYYNASHVHTKDQNYIVGQPPLKKSLNDFFTVILKYDCPLIVSLAMAKEGYVPFWQIDENEPLLINNFLIKREGEDLFLSSYREQRLVLRSFVATHTETNEIKRFKQLHIENIPDYSIPAHPIFIQALQTVEEMSLSSSSPIFIHCKAGVGRSGVFLLAHNIRKHLIKKTRKGELLQDIQLNIPSHLLMLRHQRMSLVGLPHQYRASLLAILNLAKEKTVSVN